MADIYKLVELFGKQASRRPALLVSRVARICAAADDSEAELQKQAEIFELADDEQAEVRELLKENNEQS
jgi:hypothetical protein